VAIFPERQTVKSSLEQFCANMLRIVLSPQQVSLIRMISMESGKYPALAKRFYEHGPKASSREACRREHQRVLARIQRFAGVIQG
jgi:hypothetical protein